MPVMIAIAATLVGCSREPSHQSITPTCAEERQFASLDRAAAPPIEFSPFEADPPIETEFERPRHRASDRTARLATTKSKPTLITAKPEPSANGTALPPLPSNTQLEPKSGIAPAGSIEQATVGLVSNSKSILEQVTAAITVAKQRTVAGPAADGNIEVEGRPPNNDQGLVAIVMARPEIRSVSDLWGKEVAMDEEYSELRKDVLVGFMLKRALPSQVSAGHTTAINRLLNGEVPAAVLALVSTDSAEGFPDIEGFKIFQVPLLRTVGHRDTPERPNEDRTLVPAR